MAESQKWQDKTDDTLGRIEGGVDANEGLSLTFRETVLIGLTKIDAAMAQNDRDHKTILPLVQKIPLMENGLNNHLHLHDAFRKYIFYPVVVAFVVGFGGLFCKLVLHIF